MTLPAKLLTWSYMRESSVATTTSLRLAQCFAWCRPVVSLFVRRYRREVCPGIVWMRSVQVLFLLLSCSKLINLFLKTTDSQSGFRYITCGEDHEGIFVHLLYDSPMVFRIFVLWFNKSKGR